MQDKSLGPLAKAIWGAIAMVGLSLFASTHEAHAMNACTPSIEPGIQVTLTDATTGRPLEAQISIQDGSFQEVLEVGGATPTGQLIYRGAFERPGRYKLQIAKPGYKPLVLTTIEVKSGTCHVQTRRLALRLEPVPARRPIDRRSKNSNT